MAQEIKIKLKSEFDKSGVDAAKESTKQLQGDVNDALKSIGGTFGKIAAMLASGKLIGASVSVLVSGFKYVYDFMKKGAEEAWNSIKRNSEESAKKIADSIATINSSYSQHVKGLSNSFDMYSSEVNAMKELAKAQTELAKQKAIASGMNEKDAEQTAKNLTSLEEENAELEKSNAIIRDRKNNIEEAKKAIMDARYSIIEAKSSKSDAEEVYNDKLDEFIKSKFNTPAALLNKNRSYLMEQALTNPESRARYQKEFDQTEKAANIKKDLNLESYDKSIRDAEKIISELQLSIDKAKSDIRIAETQQDIIDAKAQARIIAERNELDAKEKKEFEEQIKLAQEKEEQARQFIQETERLAKEAADKELKEKLNNLKKLKDANDKINNDAKKAAEEAGTKLESAWSNYRDPNKMREARREEREDARAKRRFERDAESLKQMRKDWRTAENLSDRQEAVKRILLAQEEKQKADENLKNIEENTREIVEKIEQLTA